MSKNLYIIIGFFVSTLMSVIFFGISNVVNSRVLNQFTIAYENEVTNQITTLGNVVRNDLIENHVLVAQNKLQKMINGTRVRDFEIFPISENTFHPIRAVQENDTKIITYNVSFKDQGQKWGEIQFKVSMLEVLKLKDGLREQAFYASIALWIFFIMALGVIYGWMLKVSTSINFHLKKSMNSQKSFKPKTLTDYLWSPLFKNIYKSSKEVKKLRFQVRELKGQEKFFKLIRKISHDIRSPVGALRAVVNRSTSITPKEKEILDKVSLRIKSISEEVLDSARSDLIEVIELSEFNAIVKGIIVEKKLTHPNIILDNTSIVPHLRAKLTCNKIGLQNIISNLLNNSIEASSSQNLITVKIEHFPSRIIMCIQDEGRGISQENINKILKGVFTSKDLGNSLGVSTSKNLVEAWGGEFSFCSQVGLGTEISIKLPIVTV